MRGLRSTLALLLVFAGLGAYIYLGKAKRADDAPPKEKLFASVDSTKISELKIKSTSGDVTTLKKEGDAWNIVAPISAPAGDSETSAITSAIASMDIADVVEESSTDLKTYGLETPRIEVEFKADDGKAGHLFIGDKTATTGSLYVRRDDQKRVLLIGDYNESNLNKSTFELRDKAIVKFDRTKVDGLDVNVAGKTLEFAKANGEWSMTKPMAARADFATVDGLVSKVESTHMKSVVEGTLTAADLKKYGFDKPQAVVNLHIGSARAALVIGAKADDTSIYVRDASKPDLVYTAEAGSIDDFKKPAEDYRRKELFDFRSYNVTRIEITRSGQAAIFERVKAKDATSEDTWHRVSPNPGDPDRAKVDSFLAGMADLRATSFVPSKTNTGVDSPVMTVVAKFDEGKREEKVTFGKNASGMFGSRQDDPGAAQIDPARFDETVKALDELSK